MQNSKLIKLVNLPSTTFNLLAPVFDLMVRIYLAKVFFMSALTKVQSWETTLFLFQYEYNVMFLSAKTAAYLGTAAELVLPWFLVLGFASRIPTLALFGFNFVAAYSYPYLMTDAGACALKDHIYWGLLIGYLVVHGTGKLSVDYIIQKNVCKSYRV